MFLIPLLLTPFLLLNGMIIMLMGRCKWPRRPRRDPVTVVVCARDEEEAIGDCLESLTRQSYPGDLYQLLLVDHLSQDRTGEIMDRFASETRLKTRVIHVTEEDGELQGKVQALDIALDQVETEFVLLTDADCVTPPAWIETMMEYMEDDVAVINAHVRVEDQGCGNRLLASLQNTLNRMYLAYSAGNSAFQLPRDLYPAALRPIYPLLRRFRTSFNMGNNQGLRMSVYRSIGGFRHVGPTLIEDVALVDRILHTTDYKVAVIMDARNVVTTRPSHDLREFWRQYRRWASAMESVRNSSNSYIYALGALNRIVVPWLVLLAPVTGLLGALTTVYGEWLLIQNANRIMGTRTSKQDFALHYFGQIVLNHVLLIALILRVPVIWKGRVYES